MELQLSQRYQSKTKELLISKHCSQLSDLSLTGFNSLIKFKCKAPTVRWLHFEGYDPLESIEISSANLLSLTLLFDLKAKIEKVLEVPPRISIRYP